MDIMATPQDLLAIFKAELRKMELELLSLRQDVRAFVRTEHTAAGTVAFQEEVNESEAKLSAILKSIIETQDVLPEFEAETTALCQRCRDLDHYMRDMNQSLAADLAERRRIEDQNKVDAVKYATFVVAMPAAFVTALKGGVGEGYVTSYQAAGAGLMFGAGVICREKIKKAFKGLGKTLCDMPRQTTTAFKEAGKAFCKTPEDIKNSFLLYYIKETTREKLQRLGVRKSNVKGLGS